MWTGFTRFGWSATYQFIKNSPEVDIVFDADFMGNSTEVALEWTGDTDGTCLAGTPFGSRVRHEDKPGGNGIFCGEAFPANGWVRSGGIAVFNKDCPGHALRKNKLESVSYTHLTLPTILLVQISVVAGSLKKKKTYKTT
eukprot:TRINITY_DN40605_c0_g1_i1.p3 TRINITY_DN40605_c0_g1~~TRINITY_DN40605_c0_g1_i1.p3  ORF type:complete len:140 (-),score=28.15 TRINITY_DN40605_c0_g1_i1:47-466(-)